MGLIKILSTAGCGNPDPQQFEIIKTKAFGDLLIALVEYPSCNNFEGLKILVYEGVTADSLRSRTEIDPHFSEDGFSPVARFEPTELGLRMAVSFCLSWSAR